MLNGIDEQRVFDENIATELTKVSHREYTTGFYDGKPDGNQQLYTSNTYIQDYTIVAVVKSYDEKTGIATLEQRNRFFAGDELEAMMPGEKSFSFKSDYMTDENDEHIDVAPHPQMTVKIKPGRYLNNFAIIRKKV